MKYSHDHYKEYSSQGIKAKKGKSVNDGFFLSEVNNAITPVVLLGRVIAHDPCLGSGASSNPGDRTARTRGSNFYGARSRKTNLFRTANRAIYHIAQGGLYAASMRNA